MLMRKWLIAAAATSVLSLPAHGSGGGFAGATEITQLANNTELVLSYVEQAQQTVHQFNQYLTMLRNLQKLTPSTLLNTVAQKLWQDQGMNSSFRGLYQIVVGGQRIAYSLRTMDSQLRRLNPGHGNYANFDYQGAYRDWSDTARGATMSALQVAAAHAEDFQSEADVISELSSMSESVDGQVQAIQAGHQIGIAMVSQLQKLRQLQMAQIQAQNSAALGQQARRDAADGELQRGIDRARNFRVERGQGYELYRPAGRGPWQ